MSRSSRKAPVCFHVFQVKRICAEAQKEGLAGKRWLGDRAPPPAPTPRNLPSKKNSSSKVERRFLLELKTRMSNAAAGSVESAKMRQEEESDGLRRAEPYNQSSGKAEEEDLVDACSSKQAMEEGFVDRVCAAQHGDLSSKQVMQEGHADGVHMAEHGESNNEKVTEEGFDDGLRRAQHAYVSSKKETHEGYDGGSHEDQRCDRSCEKTMEEGHSDGIAEKQRSHEHASSPAPIYSHPENAATAQNPHHSYTHASSTDFGTLSEHHNQCAILHGESGAQANLAACGTSGKQHTENVASANESGGDADRDLGAHGRPMEYLHAASTASFQTLGEHRGASSKHHFEESTTAHESAGNADQDFDAHGGSMEYSHATYMAPYRTLGERMHEDSVTSHTVGEHLHENTSASDATEQRAGGNSFADDDLHTEGGQSGRYPHNTMFANGSAGDHAHESVCNISFKNGEFRGNVYDHAGTNNESDVDTRETMTAYDERGTGDFKIDLNQNVSSMQAPSFTKSPIKNGSIVPGSSYYTTQSGSMKNILLMLRFGSAIFSLIAFSVIISTSEKRVAAGSTFYVKFSDFQAYNYLAALNLLSLLYSSGQLVLLARGRSNRILSSPIKWGVLIYLCDQVLAFLMISSSSSGATASELSQHGLRNIWPPACSTWKLSLFCSKADVAVAMSFISFLFMLLSSFSSGYHLSKLLAE